MRAQPEGTIAPVILPWGRWVLNIAAGGCALLLGLAVGRWLVSPGSSPLSRLTLSDAFGVWTSWALPLIVIAGHVGAAYVIVVFFSSIAIRRAQRAEGSTRGNHVLKPTHLELRRAVRRSAEPDPLLSEKEAMLRRVMEDNLRLRRGQQISPLVKGGKLRS